jgi:hypothetical protein
MGHSRKLIGGLDIREIPQSNTHATHIVIATEDEEIEGKLTVLESSRGDLRPGGIIFIPELASFKRG